MSKINLTITGCMGRMGQQLIKSSKSNKNFNLKALTEHTAINKKIHGVKPELNSEDAFEKTDIIIAYTGGLLIKISKEKLFFAKKTPSVKWTKIITEAIAEATPRP